MMTAIAIVPLLGGLALAVDYAELSRQRAATIHALDAAGLATARRIAEGANDTEAKAYAQSFFEANLGPVDPADAVLHVTLPTSTVGGGLLKLSADLDYKPYFVPTFQFMLGKEEDEITRHVAFTAHSDIQLKNTLEVALVLDNSGSMDYLGSGSGKKRMVLLKEAAKQLVETIAGQASQMKQISKPVQFGVVPFAASVNVGPANATATWMDTQGLSPIHYENFTWSTAVGTNKGFSTSDGRPYKNGSNWGAENGHLVTRFTLFNDLKRNVCTGQGSKKTCVATPFVTWKGCVESRPSPYNTSDAVPSSSTPATLFVPMFAPDEPGNKWTKQSDGTIRTFDAYDSWWDDVTTSTSTTTTNQRDRQAQLFKYFNTASESFSVGDGPNLSCTTTEVTPLTDVSTQAGIDAVKGAIDAMQSLGATNVPEGLAWGWRVVSSTAPFTGGRAESERGNDKVVIVLTDGANTYYTPASLGSSDPAGNKSTYSAYGYTGRASPSSSDTRLFLSTSSSVGKSDYSNDNYTTALNEHFAKLCDNAKAGNLILMTVSLDLSTSKTVEKEQIAALKACASESRFRKDPDNPAKGAKLYWNATGSSLAEKFKEIADELSNLRIVG